MHTNNKIATDVYDVVWLLVVIFTRLANFLVVEIDELDLDASGFTTCFVAENRDDLGESPRLVQELHRYFQ